MIKKLFYPGNYPQNINFALLLLRVSIGVLMLTHGLGKLYMLTGDAALEFADPLGIGVATSLTLTVFAEVFCSLLLILGIATRLAAIPLLITMLVAALIVHVDHGFGKQEMALIYGLIYLTVAITGAGKFSIDTSIYRKLRKSK